MIGLLKGNLYKFLAGGLGLALILTTTWALRVNHLRDRHLTQISSVVALLKENDHPKANAKNASEYVGLVLAERARFLHERDTAIGKIEAQNDSIQSLSKKGVEARLVAEEASRKVEAVARERDKWIKSAREAGNRTESFTPDEELKECAAAMDGLFRSGF